MVAPFVNTVATGRNIDTLRTHAGLSVRDMQMVFGFAIPQAIYKWFHGTALPTIDNLVILAAMLGVTMDEIVVVETAAGLSIRGRRFDSCHAHFVPVGY